MIKQKVLCLGCDIMFKKVNSEEIKCREEMIKILNEDDYDDIILMKLFKYMKKEFDNDYCLELVMYIDDKVVIDDKEYIRVK